MKSKITTTPTESLRLLWQQGFLKKWQNQPAIVEELGKKDYHFTTSELSMALMRAKYLTRRGKRGSYEYIQKHPFTEDEE